MKAYRFFLVMLSALFFIKADCKEPLSEAKVETYSVNLGNSNLPVQVSVNKQMIERFLAYKSNDNVIVWSALLQEYSYNSMSELYEFYQTVDVGSKSMHDIKLAYRDFKKSQQDEMPDVEVTNTANYIHNISILESY
ncbi:MAG: hypothetical protein HC896_02910 [Bacteroidales bacterium]|nr:hypothetical protein [Bacteroidales bacterium]